MKNTIYDLSMNECCDLIEHIGAKRTVEVCGALGSGKTQGIRAELQRRFPDHTYIEFDCTNKDVQDLSVPKFMQALEDHISDYVEFVPNSELGVHLGKPIILNFDEMGKASPTLKKGTRRVYHERAVNGIKLPEGSIVYMTSNLGSEGLGDGMPAHQRNTIIRVRMRKPNAEEWVDWGMNNGIDPAVLGFVTEYPQVLQSYEDVSNPEENEYIHDPRVQRDGVCTARTLHMVSDTLKVRDKLTPTTLTAAMIGTIGIRGALDLQAFVTLADQLPTLQSIKDDPENARVPDSANGVCLVVYRALSMIERDWFGAWCKYMERLGAEAQALFIMNATKTGYKGQSWIMNQPQFKQWCLTHGHLVRRTDDV